MVYVPLSTLYDLNSNLTYSIGFYINLPAGAVTAIFLLLINIPSGKMGNLIERTHRALFIALDVIGFAIFAPACVMFLLAIEWGGVTCPWDSATVIGLFCGSFATAVLFFMWEYHKGAAAMIPLQMLRQRVIWCSCVTGLFQMGGLLLITYFLPLWFQFIKHATPTNSGLMSLPTFIGQIITAMGSGWAGRYTLFIFYTHANGYSHKTWILYPVGNCWVCSYSRRIWGNEHIFHVIGCRIVDRVSGLDWSRERNGTATARHGSPIILARQPNSRWFSSCDLLPILWGRYFCLARGDDLY